MEALSKEQILGLLATARAARTRDWVMILVAFCHGLRASEVLQITADDVADGVLTVRRLKGSKRTVQALLEHEDELLNERAAVFDFVVGMTGNQKLFPISRQHFWRLMRKYCAAAGIPLRLAHPHVLKHSIAMQIIHSAGIENTRQWLGHKSMASTGEYLKVSDQEATIAVSSALGGGPKV